MFETIVVLTYVYSKHSTGKVSQADNLFMYLHPSASLATYNSAYPNSAYLRLGANA